jgi:tetratricopeptide (TPR) repeat protein
LPLVSKNEENPFLPLVVNVVTKYWGEDIFPQKVETGSEKGSAMIHGIQVAERSGFASYIYKSSIKDLKRRIDQGIPPIVIMPGIWGTVQHALIMSGYNSDERRILTYIPEPDTVGAIPESKFEQDWEEDDMTAIVIIPSDMKDLVGNENNLRFAKSNRACFEAEGLREKGSMSEAILKLQRATELDSNNAQAWSLLGGIYNETDSNQAIHCFERAIELNPRCYLAYRGLGNHYLKTNNFSLAEEFYGKAIMINPTRFGPIYKNRAITRIKLGNNQGAKEDLLNYLEKMPEAQDRPNIEEALAQL